MYNFALATNLNKASLYKYKKLNNLMTEILHKTKKII